MDSGSASHLPPGMSELSAKFGLTIDAHGVKKRKEMLAAGRLGGLPPGIPPPYLPLPRAGGVISLASIPPSSIGMPTPPGAGIGLDSGVPVNSKAKYGPVSEKGALAIVHNLYQSAPDAHKVWTWVDEYPTDIKEAAEGEETEKCAIIMRNVKCTDGRRNTKAHSIVVQSPYLRKVLSEILHDYPGVCCDLQRLEFIAPFEPFVHRWAGFLKCWKRGDHDETTREHIDLLYNTLQAEIGETIREFEDFVLNGVVTFKSLWMIFQPGSIILSAYRGETLSAFELCQTQYAKDSCGEVLAIAADAIAWNGKNFGRCMENLPIRSFTGTKKITSLLAYPLHFHGRKEDITAGLIERGRAYEELAGFNFKAYNGPAMSWDTDGKEIGIEVTGRVIVDINSFVRYAPPYVRRTQIRALTDKDLEMLAEYNKDDSNPRDEYEDLTPEETGFTLEGSSSKRVRLGPYHRMLCQSRVAGYSLKTKKWLELFVQHVKDIEWDEHAFESLVLAQDQKEMVLAFSESHLQNRGTFDDVISGKGKGMIMLLSGPPGVGKTLTAEAVAEHMHCPLHSITSGDLGCSPVEVERNLTWILALVARWNAVLLIDECDVFLEARANRDLERNKMVSIFLRMLEYYEGIMFMTTNRAGNIDAAFQSRIHVSIEYPELAVDSRRQIWTGLVKCSSVEHELSDADLDRLAQLPLNGRQIKNVLRSAQLLALRRKTPLSEGLVKTVYNIEQRRTG